MKILAIETSCDETGAAVVESSGKEVIILSNVIASSMSLHSKTGGIIPENAAREQVKYIIPVIQESLEKAGLTLDADSTPEIDAIAVTYGPGLIGSLFVGVETAKTLSFLWKKPLIPVNHLFGHIYANWLMADSTWQMGENHKAKRAISNTPFTTPEFPLVALIVSGGHTDLLLMKSHTDKQWLGGTRDDAAGECFDKSGRLMGLSYPAGPEIEEKAKSGNPKAYHFPRPLMHDNAYDFSFSGLKTAILREVEKTKNLDEQAIQNICRGLQDAISDVLVNKTLKAAQEYNAASILLSGGVAANQTLTEQMKQHVIHHMPKTAIFVPQKSLCTDNAAMIGAAAIFQGEKTPWQEVTANPELYFD